MRQVDGPELIVKIRYQLSRLPASLRELSRMIGRWDGYLHRFVAQGCPLALSPTDHAQLADFFGVEERGLGVRLLWAPMAA